MKKITALSVKEANKPIEILHKEIFKSNLDNLPEGRYRFTVEKYSPKATQEQFGWLYACVYPHSLIALNAAGWEFTTIDEIDIFWKNLFANKDNLNRNSGEIVKLPLSKSAFVTIDQMAYCESIRTYCAEFLGYDIPDPIKKKKQHEII